MSNNDNLYQSRIAVNMIGLALLRCDDADSLALISNQAAALHDLFGCDFIDWELISDACERREYSLTMGEDANQIDELTFGSIVNRIQARFGLEATSLLDDIRM